MLPLFHMYFKLKVNNLISNGIYQIKLHTFVLFTYIVCIVHTYVLYTYNMYIVCIVHTVLPQIMASLV